MKNLLLKLFQWFGSNISIQKWARGTKILFFRFINKTKEWILQNVVLVVTFYRRRMKEFKKYLSWLSLKSKSFQFPLINICRKLKNYRFFVKSVIFTILFGKSRSGHYQYKFEYYSWKIKDFIYQIIFGRRLGTYSHGHLLFPIIVVNNTLLLELNKERSIQKFFDDTLGDDILNNFSSEKVSLFNFKLLELIEKEGNKPFPYDSNTLEHPKFSDDFTLNIYKEWKVNPDFLLYVFSYYFENFQIYFYDELQQKENCNYFIKIDISFLFIYQEQANYLADRLSEIFKEELTEEAIKKYRFSDWLSNIIKNLYKVDLPYENPKNRKNGLKQKIKTFFSIFIFFILYPLIPIIVDLLILLISGKYGIIFLAIFLYFILNKLKYYI